VAIVRLVHKNVQGVALDTKAVLGAHTYTRSENELADPMIFVRTSFQNAGAIDVRLACN
jgi:hypothetical protein